MSIRGKVLDSTAARHADALAYIGNGKALLAVSDLCNTMPELFCQYVERTLDYAEGRNNAFMMIYEAIPQLPPTVQGVIARWMNSVIHYPHFQQRLAEAIVLQYQYGGIPDRSVLVGDAVISRLTAVPEHLTAELEKAAQDQPPPICAHSLQPVSGLHAWNWTSSPAPHA